jgi:hypothetical protein
MSVVAIAKYNPEGTRGDKNGGGAGNIFNVRGPLRGNSSQSPPLHRSNRSNGSNDSNGSNGNYDTSSGDEPTRQQHVVSNPYIVHWEEQDVELNDFIMAIDWGNVPEVERANALVETIGIF